MKTKKAEDFIKEAQKKPRTRFAVVGKGSSWTIYEGTDLGNASPGNGEEVIKATCEKSQAALKLLVVGGTAEIATLKTKVFAKELKENSKAMEFKAVSGEDNSELEKLSDQLDGPLVEQVAKLPTETREEAVTLLNQAKVLVEQSDLGAAKAKVEELRRKLGLGDSPEQAERKSLLAQLQGRLVEEVAKRKSPGREELIQLVNDAMKLAKDGDLEVAKEKVAKIKEALLVPEPPDPPPSLTSGQPKAPISPEQAKFDDRLKRLLPAVINAQQEKWSNAAELKLAIGEAQSLFRKREYDQANSRLDEVESLLQSPNITKPEPTERPDGESVPEWAKEQYREEAPRTVVCSMDESGKIGSIYFDDEQRVRTTHGSGPARETHERTVRFNIDKDQAKTDYQKSNKEWNGKQYKRMVEWLANRLRSTPLPTWAKPVVGPETAHDQNQGKPGSGQQLFEVFLKIDGSVRSWHPSRGVATKYDTDKQVLSVLKAAIQHINKLSQEDFKNQKNPDENWIKKYYADRNRNFYEFVKSRLPQSELLNDIRPPDDKDVQKSKIDVKDESIAIRRNLIKQMALEQAVGSIKKMTPEQLKKHKTMPAMSQEELEKLEPVQLQERLEAAILPEIEGKLNEMFKQRQPDFDGFMRDYGEFFPKAPKSLDELLET